MIGREIVQILCDAGSHIKVVSLDKIKIHDKVEHVYGDLTSLNLCLDVRETWTTCSTSRESRVPSM